MKILENVLLHITIDLHLCKSMDKGIFTHLIKKYITQHLNAISSLNFEMKPLLYFDMEHFHSNLQVFNLYQLCFPHFRAILCFAITSIVASCRKSYLILHQIAKLDCFIQVDFKMVSVIDIAFNRWRVKDIWEHPSCK